MASYLATATIGEFDICAPTAGRHQLLGRDRPRPVRAARRRAPARSFAISRGGQPRYKRLTRTIGVPAGGAQLSFWVDARHRAGLGLHLRRGPHGRAPTTGRRCPTSTATRSDDTGNSLPAAAGRHPPVPRALPDRRRRRHVHPTGTTGDVERGERRRATARSSGRSTSPPTRAATSRSRSATPATRSSSSGVVRRRRRRSPARPARPRSRTTATRSTAGPSRARPPAARPTRTTGSSARSPTGPRTRRRRSPSASLRPPARDHRLPVGPLRAATRSRRPAAIVDDARLGFALENQTRPDLLARDFFDDRGEPSRLGRRPRARAPVGRRQPGRRQLAAHLAQRGLRDLRRVAVERARGRGTPRRSSTALRRRSRPTTRSGARRSAIPGRTTCSTSRSTTAAR